ncbi:MAG: extracellular solute-binding protein, partial [Lentisphaerota bacterium]
MRTRHWILALSTALSFTALTADALVEGKLLIWINGDKAYTALAEIGKKFEADNGIPVTVEHPTDLPTKYAPAAQTGNGPDLVFWAHDRLGSWAASGLIQPLQIEAEYKAQFHPKSWEAFTYDGKIWGYPVCLESVALIYNKSLVKAIPA